MNLLNMLNLMSAAPQPGQQTQSPMPMLVMMLLIFGIFYFMMIRPQQRKERERRKMIEELRVGQRVLFAGGLLGTIVEAREHTFRIELAQGVVIEVVRGAVSRVLREGETAPASENA